MNENEILRRAAAYCSGVERCASEVRAKMATWGIADEQTEAVVKRLEDEGFLNESRFAQAFANDKFRFNGWGKVKIAYMLRQKGIGEESIGEALCRIGEEEYETALATLLRAKLRGLKYRDDFDRQAKLYRFAQSRGFEQNTIHKVLRKM